jgi:hypothetical protein
MLEQLARKIKAEGVTAIQGREEQILQDVANEVISNAQGRSSLNELYVELEWLQSKDPLTEADTLWEWLTNEYPDAAFHVETFLGGLLGEWSRFNALSVHEKETRKRAEMLESLRDAVVDLALSDVEHEVGLYHEVGAFDSSELARAASKAHLVHCLDPFTDEQRIIRHALMTLAHRSADEAERISELMDYFAKV